MASPWFCRPLTVKELERASYGGQWFRDRLCHVSRCIGIEEREPSLDRVRRKCQSKRGTMVRIDEHPALQERGCNRAGGACLVVCEHWNLCALHLSGKRRFPQDHEVSSFQPLRANFFFEMDLHPAQKHRRIKKSFHERHLIDRTLEKRPAKREQAYLGEIFTPIAVAGWRMIRCRQASLVLRLFTCKTASDGPKARPGPEPFQRCVRHRRCDATVAVKSGVDPQETMMNSHPRIEFGAAVSMVGKCTPGRIGREIAVSPCSVAGHADRSRQRPVEIHRGRPDAFRQFLGAQPIACHWASGRKFPCEANGHRPRSLAKPPGRDFHRSSSGHGYARRLPAVDQACAVRSRIHPPTHVLCREDVYCDLRLDSKSSSSSNVRGRRLTAVVSGESSSRVRWRFPRVRAHGPQAIEVRPFRAASVLFW